MTSKEEKKGHSQIPVPIDIPTPKMKKKKKRTEDDHSLLPTDLLAHSQKKKIKQQEENVILPPEGHTKELKKNIVEENILSAETHTHKKKKKKKEREKSNENNTISADEGNIQDGENRLAPVEDISNQKRKTQKEDSNCVFSADEYTPKKRKRQKEKQDDLTADMLSHEQRTKCIEAEPEAGCVLPADIQKKKKRQVENMLPADGALEKHKGKKTKRVQDIQKEEQRQVENMLPDDGALEKHKKKKKKRVHEKEENSFSDGMHTKKKKKRTVEEEDGILPPKKDEEGVTLNQENTWTMIVTESESEETIATPTTTNRNWATNGSVSLKTATTKESNYDDELDPALVAEMEEFLPNMKNKSASELKRLLRYDLDRFRLFKSKGMSIRTGRFTLEENQRLRDNIAKFLDLTGIATIDQLLFPQRYKDLEAGIKKLKKQHHFMEFIAEGIPRPCKLILTRALKLDQMNHMGPFSKEEVEQLIKLQKIHGNKWTTIALKMDRSSYAVQKRFSQLALGRGSWTCEEERKLKEVVKAHLEVLAQQSSTQDCLNLEQLCTQLPWKEISHHVGTRSWTQCRLKWFSFLKNQMFERKYTTKSETVKTQLNLINTLHALNIEDARDIDWEMVSSIVGGVTPICVQKLFRRLKVCYVHNWSQLSYGEIIDILLENVAPRLLRELKHKLELDETVQAVPPNDMYSLIKIFESKEDEDFVEMDNTLPKKRRSKHSLE